MRSCRRSRPKSPRMRRPRFEQVKLEDEENNALVPMLYPPRARLFGGDMHFDSNGDGVLMGYPPGPLRTVGTRTCRRTWRHSKW